MHFNSMSEGDIAFFIAALVSWLFVSWLNMRLLEFKPRGEKLERQTILVHLGLQGVSFFLFTLSTGYISILVGVIATLGWLTIIASCVDLLLTLDANLLTDRTSYGRISIDLAIFGAGIGIMALAF